MSPFPGALNPRQVPMLMHRVRGGGSAFTPASLSGLQLWLAADSGDLLQSSGGSAADADGDPVGLWPDKSGNGNHASQSTTAAKPTLKTDIINGKPVLRFDGTDDWIGDRLNRIIQAAGQPTIFVVLSGSGSSSDTFLSIGEDDATTGHIGQFTREYGIRVRGGNEVYSASASGSFEIFEAVQGGANVTDYRAFVDGSELAVSSSTAAATDYDPGFVLGAKDDENFISEFIAVDIAEVLVYDKALSTSKRQSVRDYLADKYGITLA